MRNPTAAGPTGGPSAAPSAPADRVRVVDRVAGRPRAALPFAGAGYAFVAFFLLALVAFWPGYLRTLPEGGFYRHFHGAAMTTWFALLIAQPMLVRGRRFALHRRLGAASYVVAPLALLSMLLLTHARIADFTDAGDVGGAILPLAMAALFAVTYGLAIAYRERPALHARYMVATSFALVDPVGARLIGYYVSSTLPGWAYQGTTFVLTDVFVLWLIWRERRAPRGRAAFPVVLAVMLVLQAANFVLPHVPAWVAAMRWFRGLPLT